MRNRPAFCGVHQAERVAYARFGHFLHDIHIHRAMLDDLERTDRFVELLARLDVVERHLQRLGADADELGGRQCRRLAHGGFQGLGHGGTFGEQLGTRVRQV